MDTFNSYVKNPIIRAQHKQLLYAKKQHPRKDRGNYAIISYGRITKLKHKPSIRQEANKLNRKPLIENRYNSKKVLRQLFDQYLKHWKQAIRATVLNGLFFRNYSQSYNALNRFVSMGLLVKTGQNYFVVAQKE